jgi:hypothetical protein
VEDVDHVRELMQQRMRATGIEEDLFDRLMDLLGRFDTDREKLFEEMLNKLEAPGYDGLNDRWSTNCEQAQALLQRLEEQMIDILGDSQANAMSAEERMRAVGPVDFLAGERKIWAQVAKGDVPGAATLLGKTLEVDLGVIKKCGEELTQARNDDKVIETLLTKNFGSVTDTAKRLLAKYAVTSPARLIVLLMKDDSNKNAAKEAIQAIEKIAEENYTAARDKRVAKEVVLRNIKLLTDAKEQLDEAWIDKLFARGAEAASGWRSAGQGGDYEAADWEGMKTACIEALDRRAEAAKEQSRKIYNELYPAFVEESTNAFAQLTDSPDTLERFSADVKSTFGSLDELMGKEAEYAESLEDGPAKQAMKDTLDLVWTSIKAGVALALSRTKDADDEVKK